MTTREGWCICIAVIVVAASGIWFTLASIAFEQDRTVYVPFQAPWIERNQTLIAGILAAAGGAAAVLAGFMAYKGAVDGAAITARTTNTDRVERFAREDDERRKRIDEKRALVRQQAVVMVIREALRLTQTKALLVREAAESHKREITSRFRTTIEDKCRIRLPTLVNDLDFADCFTATEIANIVLAEFETQRLEWKIDGLILAVNSNDMAEFRRKTTIVIQALGLVVNYLNQFATAVEPTSEIGLEVNRALNDIRTQFTSPPLEADPEA